MKFLLAVTLVQWLSQRPATVAANASNDPNLMWPSNPIPYEFETTLGFSEAGRTRIVEAMEIIINLTGRCVKFVERISETDYIMFQGGDQSFAYIGRTGGKQVVSLSSASAKHYGYIQHELTHVLGFFHEHSRVDRDDHVIINWNNIAKGNKVQFDKHAGERYGLPYYYESVMHYAVKESAVDKSLPTILPKVGRVQMGQKEKLSPLDVARISRRFQCDVPSGENFVKLQSKETQTNQQNISTMNGIPSGIPSGVPLEPFPTFSGEPMSSEQCAYQFNGNCVNPGYTVTNCTRTQALHINCKSRLILGS